MFVHVDAAPVGYKQAVWPAHLCTHARSCLMHVFTINTVILVSDILSLKLLPQLVSTCVVHLQVVTAAEGTNYSVLFYFTCLTGKQPNPVFHRLRKYSFYKIMPVKILKSIYNI
jgi:hypothetical protein